MFDVIRERRRWRCWSGWLCVVRVLRTWTGTPTFPIMAYHAAFCIIQYSNNKRGSIKRGGDFDSNHISVTFTHILFLFSFFLFSFSFSRKRIEFFYTNLWSSQPPLSYGVHQVSRPRDFFFFLSIELYYVMSAGMNGLQHSASPDIILGRN